ncbi:MAG: glycosyltransferase, partial [Thermoplasmata archaeon]
MDVRKTLSNYNLLKKIFKKKRRIKGFLDGIDGQYVFGWAWDPENPEKRLEVVVYVDGVPVAEGVADLYREDLERAGIGDGRHGFRLVLNKTFVESNEGEIKEVMLKVGDILVDKKHFILSTKSKSASVLNVFKMDILENFIKERWKQISEFNKKKGLLIEIKNNVELLNTIISTHIPLSIFNSCRLNALLYKTLAHEKLINKDLILAEKFLTYSIFYDKIPHSLELLGNIAFELKQEDIAYYWYKISKSKEITFWVYLNLCKIYENKNSYEEAISTIIEGYEKFPFYSYYFKNKLSEILNTFWDRFQKKTSTLTKLIDSDNRKLLAEEVYKTVSKLYTIFQRVYGLSDSPIVNLKKTDRVLIIAGSLDLPQCKRYRVEQKIKQFERIGIKATVVPYYKLQNIFEYIFDFDIFIFYRVPPTIEIIKLLAFINALGKASIYEIDDLIFDLDNYPPPLENFGSYVDLPFYHGLILSSILFNVIARFCRYGLASTSLLSDKLKELVFSKTCFIHKNGLDDYHLLIKKDLQEFQQKKEIVIFYGSGTLSHNQDFCALALPALERILTEYDNVKLWIAGYLKLPQEFENKFKNKIVLLGFIKQLKDYYRILSFADINLAVLFDGVFEGCKSELKWVEAASVFVPSIVSSTHTYREVIKHGIDGFIAKNSDDFYKYIKILLENPELRYEIAKNAHERVIKEYSLDNMAQNLKKIIQEIEKEIEKNNYKKNIKVKLNKRKIALVNVYFSPEEIGGATAVVVDNFYDIKRLYGDKYEFVIFTTQAHYNEDKPYSLEIYKYNGSLVYKINPNFKTNNIDWIYFDEEMKKIFMKFLEIEKPNLVHFHAIQRLTASIAEATYEKGIPYIIAVHDGWWISDWMFLTDDEGNVYIEPVSFPPKKLPKGVSVGESLSRYLFLKSILQKASFVYAPSPEFAEIYRKNGITWIKAIPNGISTRIK